MMVKIQSFNTRGHEVRYIVLPKAICDLKGWKAGDEIEFREHEGRVFIEKNEAGGSS